MRLTLLAFSIVVVLLGLADADTIQVGSVSYNGTLTFKNGEFLLSTEGHVRHFSEPDVFVLFNPKSKGSKTYKGGGPDRIPFGEGRLPTMGGKTVGQPSSSRANQGPVDVPMECLIVFKRKKENPAVKGVLLSIDDDGKVNVEAKEDENGADRKTKPVKKQTTKKPPFLKAEIRYMDCTR